MASPYADDGSAYPSSDDVRDERTYEEEQGQRLLPSEEEHTEKTDDEPEFRVEWHLRPCWVVVASILTIVLVFAAMVTYTRLFIADNDSSEFSTESSINGDFRRPASDYILDPKWNFKAPNTVRTYNWTVVDRIANPDGVYRPMIMINGKFPGPMIECNEGDTLVINVENLSSNATSMHFHGIFQNGTNWMDGTTGVTQCPIAPKSSFQYKFQVSGQSGTYYYHGHQAVQIADGLFGPLVVHGRDEKSLQRIPYVSDRVVMVQDYYHDLSSGLLKTSLEPGNEGSPVPDGALINGMNVRDCSKIEDKLCDSANSRLPIFDLSRDASHRLRFLNVGAFAWFEISLDEHDLSVTEVDGTDVEPASTSQLHISPAQRYSVIVNTTTGNEESFWLRARIMKHCFAEPDLSDAEISANAIVRYVPPRVASSTNLIVQQPTSRNTNTNYGVICRDMDNKAFVPVEQIPTPKKADHSYYLRLNLEIGDWRLERGFFNQSSFRPDVRSPTLHRVVDGLRSANESFSTTSSGDGVNSVAFDTSRELVIQTSGVKTIDVAIQSFDEGNHPLHLHGNKFWVLAQGHAYFPGFNSAEMAAIDLSNPIRRDTASVEGFGWLLIRFVTDNPGMWAFHCHMAWHSEAGLAMQFLNQPEVMKDWEVPRENLELCMMQGLEKGMAPQDDIWFGNGPD